MTAWIIDSGSSQNICSNASLITLIKPIKHVTFSLSNGTHITVSLSGDIKINLRLVLKGVLFVPQFHFNLLLVSAFIRNFELIGSFFPDHLDSGSTNKWTIGRGDKSEDLSS